MSKLSKSEMKNIKKLKQQREIITMKNKIKRENKMPVTIDTYILDINTAIQSAKKANLKIFELLLDARNTLSTNEYNELKTKIDLSKSTLQKFEKIFSNRVIMNNIEQLPFSWSVLLEMTRVEDDELQKLIDDKTFNAKTTKKEVANILKSPKNVTDPDSVAEDTTSNDVTDPTSIESYDSTPSTLEPFMTNSSSVVEDTSSNDVTDPDSVVEDTSSNDVTDPTSIESYDSTPSTPSTLEPFMTNSSSVAEDTTSNDVTDPTSIESYDSTPSTLEPFMTVTIKEDVELDDVAYAKISEAELIFRLSVSDYLDVQSTTSIEMREAA